MWIAYNEVYRQVSNISRTLVGNKIVDHSDVVGASPVGAAPTTSSFSTLHSASIYCAKTTTSRYEKHLSYGFGASYIRDFTVDWIQLDKDLTLTLVVTNFVDIMSWHHFIRNTIRIFRVWVGSLGQCRHRIYIYISNDWTFHFETPLLFVISTHIRVNLFGKPYDIFACFIVSRYCDITQAADKLSEMPYY